MGKNVVIPVIALLVVFTVLAVLLAMRNYTRKTQGRHYLADRVKFKQSYWQLIDFYSNADPYQLDLKTLPKMDWRDADGVILGKVGERLVYRPSDKAGNLCVFALPASGKTTAQIIPSALRFGGSVMAIDIKGDILAFTKNKRKIKIFAPEQPELSCHYNPLAGISDLNDVEQKNYIESLAAIILPDEKDKEGKYFVEGGRDYFCGVSLHLLSQNRKTTLPEIAEAIISGNAFKWATEIEAGSCAIAKSYTSAYIGTNEKNVAGAYSTIVKAIRPFAFGSLSTLLNDERDFITPSTLEKGYDVYIEIPQDKIRQYSPIITIIVQQFLRSFMHLPDRSSGKPVRPILFLLDEFPQLAFDYEVISSALATLRSKGVSLFLACQSISQLKERYGQEAFRSIIDTCAYISVMSAQDVDSREYFSRLCGSRKALQTGTSSGENIASQSTSIITEPVFQPADFANLGNDVIIVANGKYIRAQKTYCFK